MAGFVRRKKKNGRNAFGIGGRFILVQKNVSGVKAL